MQTRFRLLVSALILGAVACVPPPSPGFAPCSTTGPFQCVLWYVVSGTSGTYAIGIGETTEPPTFITIELTLEQKQPDGSFTGIWTDRSGGGSPTQRREYRSATVPDCAPGYYQWRLRIQFTGNNTTWYTTSTPFYLA